MRIFNRVLALENHPIRHLIPKKKEILNNLSNRSCLYYKINTQHFKTAFVYRLISKYNLA